MGCTECIPTKPFALTKADGGPKSVQALPHAQENAQEIVSQQEIMKVGALAKVSASGRVGTVLAVDPGDKLVHCKLDFHDGVLPATDWFSKDAVTLCDSEVVQPEDNTTPQEAAQPGTLQETKLPVTVPTSATDGTCGKPSNKRAGSTVSNTSETSARLDVSALRSLDGQCQTRSHFSGSISSISEGARSPLAVDTDQLSGALTRFSSMCPMALDTDQVGGPLTRFPSMCSVNLGRAQVAHATDLAQLEEELNKLSRRASQQSQIESDLGRLRESQVGECRRIEHELQEARAQAVQKVRQEAELERIKMEAVETAKLQAELKRAQADAEQHKHKLECELRSLKSENTKSRAEHLSMVEKMHERLEQERESASLIRQRDQLLEQEHNAHSMQVLQERVDEHSAEANALRQRVDDLKQQLAEAESQKGKTLQEQDKLRQELDEAVKAQDALRKARDESEQKLKEAARRRQPKCGFSTASGERQPQCNACSMM